MVHQGLGKHKELHHRESKWLRSKGGDDQNQMRSEYLEMRLFNSKAVRREKRSYQRRMRDRLEEELKCLKKLEKSMKKCIGQKNKGVGYPLEVYDKEGKVKAGEEAVKVRKEHFTKVLGASNEGAVGDEEQIGDSADINNSGTNRLDFSERLCQPITREEAAWALDKMKKDAPPGKDGVTVDMMSADVLFDAWCALFEVCWEYGMVLSVWGESLLVPVLEAL